jgi:phosphatidylglycerophosphate synthase
VSEGHNTSVVGKPPGEEGLFARIYLRRCAAPLVALLRRTGATPNQITVAFLAMMAVGAVCQLDQSRRWIAVSGAVLLEIGLILDAVDGEIARIRRMYSIKGVYLDMIGHRLVHGLLFLATGFGLWSRDHQILPVVLGSLACYGELGLTLVLYAKWRALLDHPATMLGELDRLARVPRVEQKRFKAGFNLGRGRPTWIVRAWRVWFGVDYVGALLLTTLLLAAVDQARYLLWIYAPLQFGRILWHVGRRIYCPFDPERPDASGPVSTRLP